MLNAFNPNLIMTYCCGIKMFYDKSWLKYCSNRIYDRMIECLMKNIKLVKRDWINFKNL